MTRRRADDLQGFQAPIIERVRTEEVRHMTFTIPYFGYRRDW